MAETTAPETRELLVKEFGELMLANVELAAEVEALRGQYLQAYREAMRERSSRIATEAWHAWRLVSDEAPPNRPGEILVTEAGSGNIRIATYVTPEGSKKGGWLERATNKPIKFDRWARVPRTNLADVASAAANETPSRLDGHSDES